MTIDVARVIQEYAEAYNPRRPANVARQLWRGAGQAMLVAAAVGTMLLYEMRVTDECE